MVTLEFILGVLLLLAGRKLFWLAVGIMGFLTGAYFAQEMLAPGNEWVVLAIAIGLGVLGAVFAVAFQWVGVLLMGFWGGGYLLMSLFPFMGDTGLSPSVLFIIGGIIGALVIAMTFDLSLMVITSLVGASLIVPLEVDASWQMILLIVLAIGGVIIQSSLPKTSSSPTRQ